MDLSFSDLQIVAMSREPLRILHITRAPVGGIFRHILDVANEQIERGHHVGIVTDSMTGGDRGESALADMAPGLKLGVHRIPIHREPHPSDFFAWLKLQKLMRRLNADVLHGHGAKGGLFVRMPPSQTKAIRVYTPHGGSLHYPVDTLKGAIFAKVERAMMDRTELFLFESAFARNTYVQKVGTPDSLVRCVFNGVNAGEFEQVSVANDATDLVYVGEFRHIKGADLLIDAVARLRAAGRNLTLTLAGDGEETEALKAQIARLDLEASVRFIGHVQARYGFSKGHLLVVPSRGDSMPYVVIEAAAAGIPMIAANVGGIPEVLGAHKEAMFASGNVGAMADAIEIALDDRATTLSRAQTLRQRIFKHFSQKAMVDGIHAGYRDALAKR